MTFAEGKKANLVLRWAVLCDKLSCLVCGHVVLDPPRVYEEGGEAGQLAGGLLHEGEVLLAGLNVANLGKEKKQITYIYLRRNVFFVAESTVSPVP